MELVSYLTKTPVTAKAIQQMGKARSLNLRDQITPYLNLDDKIIDIGAGLGMVDYELMAKGYNVTPVDIMDLSLIETVKPIIYDGQKLPFKKDSFDTALIITVLHHTTDPVAILREAARVAKKVIVVEEVYNSATQKYLTFLMDSVVNLEFFDHPHSNKTHHEWLKIFKSLNLKVVGHSQCNYWCFFDSSTYALRRE